jgi:hypothetical protein
MQPIVDLRLADIYRVADVRVARTREFAPTSAPRAARTLLAGYPESRKGPGGPWCSLAPLRSLEGRRKSSHPPIQRGRSGVEGGPGGRAGEGLPPSFARVMAWARPQFAGYDSLVAASVPLVSATG